MRRLVLAVLLVVAGVAPSLALQLLRPVHAAQAGSTRLGPRAAFVHLPLWFEPNRGQAPGSVRFLVHGPGSTLLLTDHGIREQGGGALTFLGARPHPSLSLGPLLPGRVNYFLGSDPARWLHDLPTYGSLTYHQLYPGIDLVLGEAGGRLTSHWSLHPGADPATIRLRLSGESLGGPRVHQAGPNAVPVTAGRWLSLAPHVVGVRVRDYDSRRPLSLEAGLGFTARVGAGGDFGYAVAVDSRGSAYIAGLVTAASLPAAVSGRAYRGNSDAFVAKVSSNGAGLVYSTYLGGGAYDAALGIAVDGSGDAYVTGETDSANFPLSGPVDAMYGGNGDAFVARLNAGGDQLLYSTFLGGTGADSGRAIAVGPNGSAYLAGSTSSPDLPVAHALQASLRGASDGFVAELSADGSSLTLCSYLGGSGDDTALAIALDSQTNIYLAGRTTSSDYPVLSGLGRPYSGHGDAFVTKLDPSGAQIIYSTLLGGSSYDVATGIAVDRQGEAYVVGTTHSRNFPTARAAQAAYHGPADCTDQDSPPQNCADAFVSKFSPTGSNLEYSTYLGGSDADLGADIAVDASGRAFVVGSTLSTDFPVWHALQSQYGGSCDQVFCFDAFVAAFDGGGGLTYSSYLGGKQDDQGNGAALDGAGNLYVLGVTGSGTTPVGAGSGANDYDSFVTKLTGLGTLPALPVTPVVVISPSPGDTSAVSLTATPVGTSTSSPGEPTAIPEITATPTGCPGCGPRVRSAGWIRHKVRGRWVSAGVVYLGEPIRFVFEVRPRKRLVSLVAYLRLTKNGREVYHHLFRKHTLRGGVWRFVLNFHFTFTKDVGRLVAHYSTVTGVNAASTVPFTLKRRR